MIDKRGVCGCHWGCLIGDDGALTPDHDCPNPCQWPACLTDAEHAQLLAELEAEVTR